MRDPRLLGLQVADADPLLPAEVAPPGVRGAGAQVAREAVARIEDVVVVDEEAAGLAVVRPDVHEVAVRVEDLDAAVAPVGDVDPPARINLDVVGVAEAGGLAALRPDATTHGADERPVGGHPDDAVVAPAVPVRYPDVAAWSYCDARRPVEVRLVVAVHARLADAHDDVALAGELEDLVAHAH